LFDNLYKIKEDRALLYKGSFLYFFFQAAAQLLSAAMIIHAHSVRHTSLSSLLLRPWFFVLVSAGAIERLCGVALGVANERDWVVLVLSF